MKLTHTLKHQDDSTIELHITVPWSEVQTVYNTVVEETVKQMELPGFRKGKAPRAMVEEKLDKSKVYEDAIRELLPQVYNEVITQEKLHPVISPKVELKEAKEDADWSLIIYTCEKPVVKLGDYKKLIKEGKVGKQQKIWVPGQDKDEKKEEEKKPTLDEILGWALGAMEAKISHLLIEQEANRSLSALIDQTKAVGLTVEQYLQSTGKTGDQLRKEYEDQASKTITLEFGLEEISDKEAILISDDDVDKVIQSAKTEGEKKQLEDQRYYITSVLRRQKTLDYLAGM